MPDEKMHVIPEPAEGARAVIAGGRAPLIKGEPGAGSASYSCGSCGTVLIEGVETDQVGGIVLKCPNCGSYNQVENP